MANNTDQSKSKKINRYLSAFLFGKKEFDPEIYAHYAYRFRMFKKNNRQRFFNWHAWLFSCFFFVYRRSFKPIIGPLIMLFVAIQVGLYFHNWPIWTILAIIAIVVMWLIAYQADYQIFRLFQKRLRQFDLAKDTISERDKDEIYQKMQQTGGPSVLNVILFFIFLIVYIIFACYSYVYIIFAYYS